MTERPHLVQFSSASNPAGNPLGEGLRHEIETWPSEEAAA
jgi:hypothetical protein